MKNRKIPNVYFILSRSDTWQDPPLSLPWQLDVPTMMMGVDVSHPDPGHQGDSMAAVVSQSTVYIHIKGDVLTWHDITRDMIYNSILRHALPVSSTHTRCSFHVTWFLTDLSQLWHFASVKSLQYLVHVYEKQTFFNFDFIFLRLLLSPHHTPTHLTFSFSPLSPSLPFPPFPSLRSALWMVDSVSTVDSFLLKAEPTKMLQMLLRA